MTSRRIRVLLADDHSLVRQGFRRILEDEFDIEVVGEASGGAQAIELDQQLNPDVVVLDMAMPEINGLHAAIEILRKEPRRRILMLSMHADEQYVRNALEAGVRGLHLEKRARDRPDSRGPDGRRGRPVSERRDRRRQVAAARRGRPVRQRSVRAAERPGDSGACGSSRSGRSNKEIAGLLGVSVNTVAVHRSNLMATLDVHKAAELVLIAVKKGLVDPQ